jgi:hypothetical protein
LQTTFHFCLGKVPVPVVYRLELAAVDCDERIGKQLKLAADQYELTTDLLDGFTIVFPEIGNGFEVRCQPLG